MFRYFSGILALSALMSVLPSYAVTLEVTELRNRSGNLLIAVFDDPGQFPDKNPVLSRVIPVANDNTLSVDLPLKENSYAISIILDENRNGKLDFNRLRIPKELFGFSNNPSIFRGAPSYQECEVEIKNPDQKIRVKLVKIL